MTLKYLENKAKKLKLFEGEMILKCNEHLSFQYS